MKFDIGLDRIKIYSSTLPLESALAGMIVTHRDDRALCYMKMKGRLSYIYRSVAKGSGVNIHFNPCLKDGYLKAVPTSILSFNAGGMSLNDIRDLAYRVFGSLANLTLSYLETRVDFFEVDFNTINKSLLVQGKKSINSRYKGETIYFGKSSSGHQVVAYDKGNQFTGVKGTWIRVEARNRFIGKDRPRLSDFLQGKWLPNLPFRRTELINHEKLFLTIPEKISLTKKGLTSFMMGIGAKRRRTFLGQAQRNVILDFNEIFANWYKDWLKEASPLVPTSHLTLPEALTEDQTVNELFSQPYMMRFKNYLHYRVKDKGST